MFDAVGKTLLEVDRGEQLDLFEGEKMELKSDVMTAETKFSSCPDCGSPLYAEEGCFKCSNNYCGYSKCS
jgi:hypothetical protein